MDALFQRIKSRYDRVLDRIAEAAIRSDRNPNEIQLVVVTKSKTLKVVNAVVNSGCKILGENYADEALLKKNNLMNTEVSWHMIGHIQSRKARLVCENFDWVHSLDRMKIANRLNRFMAESGDILPVLLECNVSGEGSKFGFPAWNEDQWFELRNIIEQILNLPHLEIRGLMTIPPWNPNPEASRPYYKKLNQLRMYLTEEFPHARWNELSMGMSNDYVVAIQEGATFVRIGTEIVGPRE